MPGLSFEDFKLAQVFEHGVTHTVTEMDNMLFSCLTMNPQPLHIDAHFSAQTEFERPLVNSLFTLDLLVGLTVTDTTLKTTVENLGTRDVAFPNRVFQGDTISATTTVLALRPSKSRPEAGLVEFEHIATKQDDSIVCRCVRAAMMHRRPT